MGRGGAAEPVRDGARAGGHARRGCAGAVADALTFSWAQETAVILETGVQNVPLAMAIMNIAFVGNPDVTPRKLFKVQLVPMVYGLVTGAIACGVGYWYSRKNRMVADATATVAAATAATAAAAAAAEGGEGGRKFAADIPIAVPAAGRDDKVKAKESDAGEGSGGEKAIQVV